MDCSRLKVIVAKCPNASSYDECPLMEQTTPDGHSMTVAEVSEQASTLYQLACVPDSQTYTNLTRDLTQQSSDPSNSGRRKKRAVSQVRQNTVF